MLSCLSFFEFLVRAGGEKGSNKPYKKKWFKLKHIQANHPRNGYEDEYETGKAWCNSQEMRGCYIKSKDGLLLHANYLPAENPERTIILCHGYRGTSFGDFAYISRFLYENNCNLLFIDQRCMGKSNGKYITFGAKEKHDIVRWAWYVSEKNINSLPIYIYGISMGGSATLMATEYVLPREVKGIIADCAFHDMRNQLKTMANDWFHLKRINILLFRVNIYCKMFANFQMKEADVTNALKTNTLPILFFHGKEDTYVSYNNSLQNYALCKAPKEIVIVENARHLCSAYVEPELY
ncbi:MAG: alpha/beta hydrolase, partial [Lachnospiraceae bacterium]|nr:alpha/beta hydrolase [Lachnospiraceae bacterium]